MRSRVLGTVEQRDAHPYRDKPQWMQQRDAPVEGGTAKTESTIVGKVLALEAQHLAERLRSERTITQLLATTGRRGRQTTEAREARAELGWIVAHLLDEGASVRAIAALVDRAPSTVKKLADDYRALPASQSRFLAHELRADDRQYVQRVLEKRRPTVQIEHPDIGVPGMTETERIARLEQAITEIGKLGIRLAQMFPDSPLVMSTVDALIADVLGPDQLELAA